MVFEGIGQVSTNKKNVGDGNTFKNVYASKKNAYIGNRLIAYICSAFLKLQNLCTVFGIMTLGKLYVLDERLLDNYPYLIM